MTCTSEHLEQSCPPRLACATPLCSNDPVLRRVLELFWPTRRGAQFDEFCPG